MSGGRPITSRRSAPAPSPVEPSALPHSCPGVLGCRRPKALGAPTPVAWPLPSGFARCWRRFGEGKEWPERVLAAAGEGVPAVGSPRWDRGTRDPAGAPRAWRTQGAERALPGRGAAAGANFSRWEQRAAERGSRTGRGGAGLSAGQLSGRTGAQDPNWFHVGPRWGGGGGEGSWQSLARREAPPRRLELESWDQGAAACGAQVRGAGAEG